MLDIARFKFISDALNSAGGFHDGKYLIQFPREDDEKYQRRQDIAFYENHLSGICNKFIGYLAKKKVSRLTGNPLLQQFIKDCDWRGNNLDVFWYQFAIEAKARGCMLLLVDMPRISQDYENINLQQQQEQRLIPFLSSITPESVTDYKFDETGNFKSISYTGTYEIGDKIESVIWTYTDTNWSVKKDNEVIDGNTHNLGQCPVLFFSENGLFPHVGEFSQIADISKRLYNCRSELDEMLRNQTFNLLTYHIPEDMKGAFNAGEVSEAVGTNNMLIYHGNTPGFAAPSPEPAKIYLEVIDQLVTRIKEIGYIVEQSNQQESGIALSIRFQALNSALMLFSKRMDDLEIRTHELVSKWLNINEVTEASWPKDYAISDVSMEIEIAQNMAAINAPKSYIDKKMKQIVTLDLADYSQEDLQEIYQEIENGNQEITENQEVQE